MSAYYNEHDPFAAQWLRNLITAGHIAPGDVDERSIADVRPADVAGYVQCHFFAGIGVWSHALRSAGWADDREVWTGSCPCQPFSAAGKQGGFADERHLWPEFFRLISERRPHVVFGEQVASPDGLAWLDAVSADMEGAGFAFGAVDTCAAGFGAPHIRQRLYFVADADRERLGEAGRACGEVWACRQGASDLMGDTDDARLQGFPGNGDGPRGREVAAGPHRDAGGADSIVVADAMPAGRPERRTVAGSGQTAGSGGASGMADSSSARRQQVPGGAPGDEAAHGRARRDGSEPDGDHVAASHGEDRATNGFWRGAEWIPCRDGKSRPAQPGTFPLAHGATQRVGRLRAYGNALCAPQAQEFIAAYLAERVA